MIKSTTKSCGGKFVISVMLPKAISKNMLAEFERIGLVPNKRMLQFGLLQIDNDKISINGVLSNRSISFACNAFDNKDECQQYVDQLLVDILKITNV